MGSTTARQRVVSDTTNTCVAPTQATCFASIANMGAPSANAGDLMYLCDVYAANGDYCTAGCSACEDGATAWENANPEGISDITSMCLVADATNCVAHGCQAYSVM